MRKTIDGVFVEVSGGEMEEAEVRQYISHLRNKMIGNELEYLKISIDGDFADLRYRFFPKRPERIRRITGCLVGTTDRWNNAKQAEEKDRVKHV